MSATLNLHRLLTTDKGYLRQLWVEDTDRTALSVAREAIRKTLRGAFADWANFVSPTELFEGTIVAKADWKSPQPKFRIQGSFAYDTVNDCQLVPPQQIDQDDGVFLPLSFVWQNGRVRPSIASKAYFALVERALKPLCDANGWTINPKKKKGSCVRVEISDRLHIDLPLYAIRDEQFEMLAEAATIERLRKSAPAPDEAELFDDVYRGLADSSILLAHRVDGWVESDPRRLEKWFAAAIDYFGPQVRRASRAYKGMRDAYWTECDLGSICIMAATVKAFGRLKGLDDSRDDIVFMRVAAEIVRVLAEPVENPAFPNDPDKYLCKDWSPQFRRDVQDAFQRIADELDSAINGTLVPSLAIEHARKAFGERVPNDATLISRLGAAAQVRSEPPRVQPRPMTPRTQSG